MQKKTLRVLALALVLALVMSFVPANSVSAVSETDEIEKSIVALYKQCLRKSGRYSFSGWCGSLVSWQLKLLGITEGLEGGNGNDQFDAHKNSEYSSGGYRVRPYAATAYTLKDALLAITENGTKDAYNIMVGFQRSNTVAGRKYGHALLINAIIDGTVYFSESYSTHMGGKFYPEGAAISCSIQEFVNYYSPWTVFEGVIHFGLKTYTENCEYFPAYLYASVTQATDLYTMPAAQALESRSEFLRTLQPGEQINVIGLYKNTEGEYWYQVEDSQVGFIRAEDAQVLTMRYDDITVSNVLAPTELRQNRGFFVKGKIHSTYNYITSVRGQIFQYGQEEQTHVYSSSAVVNGQNFSIYGTKVSNLLSFSKLGLGNYRYELAVVVGNHFFADGELQTEWSTLKLWRSDFQVVSRLDSTYSLTFDANGGLADLNAAEVAAGDSLSQLPNAKRDGYVFDGWYTADGQELTLDTVITGDMALIAKWIPAEDVTGWYIDGGRWVYLENGEQKTGFIHTDGITYHINEGGSLDTGWVVIDGKHYYFNGNGAMHLGWFEDQGKTYYLTSNGAATGWFTVDGQRYLFEEDGALYQEPKKEASGNPIEQLFTGLANDLKAVFGQ